MPNDTESPDHAGLRAEIERLNELYDRACDQVLRFANSEERAKQQVVAQEAELATLRGDNAEFQKEVNALAGQVQELRRALTDERDTGRDAEDYQWRPDPTDRASYATGEALAGEEG